MLNNALNAVTIFVTALGMLCFPALSTSNSVRAQEPPTLSAPVEVPFRLTKWNNVSVPSMVNGNYAVNLMFHTATGEVSITRDTLDLIPEVKLDKTGNSESWGGSSQIKFGSGIPFCIGTHPLSSVSVFECTHSGHQTDGKFGPRQLKSNLFEVDFDGAKIRIFKQLPAKVAGWNKLTLSMDNGMIFVEGTIHGDTKELTNRFLIHSGYSGFALLDDEFVAKNAYVKSLKVTKESELTDSGGNRLRTLKSELPRFSVGDQVFENVPVSFFEGKIGRQKMSLLGGDFLKRFNLLFDLENEVLYFRKSKHFDAEHF